MVSNEVSLLWLDERISRKENQTTLEYLCTELNQEIQTFSSLSDCSDFLDLNSQNPFLAIVSGRLTKPFLKENEGKENIVRAIIFCFLQEKYEDYPERHARVRSVVTSQEDLLREKQSLERRNGFEQLTLKAGFHFIDNQSFVNYLLLDFLFKLIAKQDITKQSLRDLRAFSKEYIEDHEKNKGQESEHLKLFLKDFKEEKIGKTIVEWYTKESFVYRMINNTLREGDIIKIFRIRAAVFCLDQKLQKIGRKSTSFPRVLYKGTKIEKHEFEFWK